MSLKCCGKNVQILRTVNLFDNAEKKHQILTIGRCRNPKCEILTCILQWWDIKNQRFEYYKPPKRKVNRFIQECEQNRYIDNWQEVQSGSWENQNWIFGQDNKAIDFNGKRHKDRELQALALVSNDKG